MKAFTLTLAALTTAAAASLSPLPAHAQGKQYVIGFSQLAFDDPWRVAFNNQMQRAVAKHPNFKLVLVNAQRDSSKQVADVENLMTQKVDALIISPNEAAPLTAIVKRAYDKGMPVIVLDRNVLGEGYTMFIGADNKMIGKNAGAYVAQWCVDQKLSACNVLEVSGLSGSPPGWP
jgi:ribose transport system substrate-binding protein